MQSTELRCFGRKFKIHLYGVLIIWTIIFNFVECNTIKGRLPETSMLKNFVQKFIQPYIQSLQFSADTPIQRALDESPVQKAIREVIIKLKPYLQDDDNGQNNKVALDGSSETTIIEFLPKPHKNKLRAEKKPSSDLQTSIHKYEKIKSEIKAALEREGVAERTKKMVTRTLDVLIAKAIGNQCPWKSVDNPMAVFRNGKDSKHNITLEEWEDLKKQYLGFLQKKDLNKSLKLFNDFHKFFSKVINDSQKLSDKYKIKCQLVKLDADDKTKVVKETERAQDDCDGFKICSDELKEFLIDFYKSINDTTVSVFKIYAAMYTKDVISDDDESKEIDSVPTVLNGMGNTVDRRVSKIYIQELNKLKLDEHKNKDANIKILREFIGVTSKRVQKHVKKHLESDLVLLRAKLLQSVVQDISMNLGLDLGNLEADMKGRICAVFVTCNGRVYENRRTMSDSGRPSINGNSVYVKVQLSLDDKLKDEVVKASKALLGSWEKKPRNNNLKNNYQMDFRRSNNLTVTRTTIEVKSTTQTISNSSDINNILKNSVLEMF